MRRTLNAFFDDYDAAARAVRRLEDAGISYRDISLLSNTAARHHIVPQGSTEDGSAGAGGGAAAGGTVGGGLGLLAGLGLITIPGLGPVVAAGWLTAALTGAAAGAATGGLVGLLVGAGVRDEDADIYAAGLERGGTLVVVRVEDADHEKARAILDERPAAGRAASAHPLIRSNRVEGTPVYDRNSTHIGKVQHLMLDKRSGEVAYVMLSSGAMLGAGGTPQAIPWAALTYDPHLQGYRSDVTTD